MIMRNPVSWLAVLCLVASCTCSVIRLDADQEALVIATVSPSEDSSGESWEVKTGNNVGDLVVLDDEPEVSSPTGKPVDLEDNNKPAMKPEIYSFKIQSDIKYRYSRTYVTSRVVNRDSSRSQEVTFKVVLPETAFISKFIMEIDGVPYEAYVKEKEEAKRVYNQAQSQGQSAGLVELNTRNANVFNVNVNIKAQSKVNFNLTYEELLSRRLGRYEQAISITPDQITNVQDFEIVVNIEESQNITVLRVPNLRNDVDAQEDAEGNNKDAIIVRSAPNKANITWKPSEKDQSQLSKQGITGKFVVQYDIRRELDAGEILVMNGYFVHFFAPENLKPLRKHVVFVLDTSGSMWGRRMEQLKEAMSKILADLSTEDFFNILTFSSDVILWSPEDKVSVSPNSNWSPPPFHGEKVVTPLEDPRKRQPFPATKENIDKAQKFIQSLVASGGTNIHDSIVKALNLTAAIKKARDELTASALNISTNTSTTTPLPSTETTTVAEAVAVTDLSTTPTTTTTTAKTAAAVETQAPLTVLPQNVESLIMFLTDGEPTVGVTIPSTIQTLIQAANKNISVPIFSLAFGEGADFPFVRKLSLQNNGFARKLYEASDAAIQLKGFYNEIASPLLSNVTFNYTTPESAYSVENVTITKFATIFGGTEIAVAGRLVPKPMDSSSPAAESMNATEVPTEVGSVTDIPMSEDVETVNKVTPTEQHYFDVYIDGFGREGAVQFEHPEVFSSPIPWGVPVRPFPPRPTPAPTQEDLFLERLWAYLTIRQLIEKDLAQESTENEIDDQLPSLVTVSTTEATSTTTPSSNDTSTAASISTKTKATTKPETPKQRALRLALKYGFVTSLTSLVVVKPNSSDVTNAVAADGKPDVPDSLAAPQSINYNSVPMNKVSFLAGGFTSHRISSISSNNYGIIPLSLSQNAQMSPAMSFALPPPGFTNGGAPILHAFKPSRPSGFASYPTLVQDNFPVSQEEEPESLAPAFRPRPTHASSTTFRPPAFDLTTSTTTTTTTATVEPEVEATTNEPALPLTLTDLTWYKEPLLNIPQNGTETPFTVAVSDVADTTGSNCTVASTGAQGQCTHLKDCVQSVFLNDFKLYSESYFCPIESGSEVLYAGACCIQS